MALQYVGGTSGSGAGTGYDVSLTSLTGGLASAPAKGDTVLVFYGIESEYEESAMIQANGYLLIGRGDFADTRESGLLGYMKVMGATPDTSVNIKIDGSNSTSVIHVWRGMDTITPQDVTAVLTEAGNSSSINNGAVTPTTAGSVVIIAGNIGSNGSYTVSTTPSGYGNLVQKTYDPGTATTTVVASKAWTSGSEDPAAWVMSGTSVDDAWVGLTCVLRPATAATVVTQGISAITSTTITPRANITATGNTPITRQGFCYVQHASNTPTVSDSTVYTDGLFWGGSYTKQITGLTGGLNYRVRPYIITGVGTYYGTTMSVIPSSDVPYKQFIDANIMVVAGGGGGGSGSSSYGNGGGGGGAGGYYSGIIGILNQTASYNITVGNGGAGGTLGPHVTGYNGQNSSAFNIIMNGGGGGGPGSDSGSSTHDINGASGGSSGGSGEPNFEKGVSPQLIVGQGNIGGVNLGGTGQGSGGGGAGGAGTDSAAGVGISNSISGSAVYYAGGGGGGGNAMAGGNGGGGTGGNNTTSATSGTANTGGGGGGSYNQGTVGAGGSGIVIISYPTGSLIATGGTITTSGGNTIHTFNSSGTFSTTQTATSNFFQLLM